MTNETILYRVIKIVWYVAYFIEALLVLRFIMRLLGANPAAEFTQVIYSLSAIPMAPFFAVFTPNALGDSVVEWSILLAMIVYWFIAVGIVKLITMGRRVPSSEAERELRSQEEI